MTVRRILLLVGLLAVAAIGAWGQSQPFTIVPTSLPVGGGVFVVGQPIPVQQLNPNPNLDASFIWSVSSGNLPPGLLLGTFSGAITGTPTQAGAYTFTVTAIEVQTPFQASQQYTLFVSTGAPLTLTPLSHPSGVAGNFYIGLLFQAGGGVPRYTWALQSGTNSDGLTLDPTTGILSGTAQAGGVFPIGVLVTDASGAQMSSSTNLNILGISTASLPNGAIAVPYSQTLAAVGNTGAVSWSLLSGALPPGLNLSPQGQITGTPTAGGTFSFQASVTDVFTGLTSIKPLSITIPLNLTITTTSLPDGTVGILYPPQTLTATGGSGPLSWQPLSNLPPGLSLSSQGQITGTPTGPGTFPFQVRVSDPVTNLTATQSLSITVTTALTVTTTSLPNGTVGISYSQTLQATGGTPPYSWSATGLPAGLTLNSSTGVLSGIPTATGTSTISVTVTDAARGTAPATLTLTIGALTISPATLPNGFVGVPYSAALTLTGNPTPITWAVVPGSGTLPAGLSLNATTGVIIGTPTSAGSSTFTISATLGANSGVPPVQKQFTLLISAAPSVTISGLPTTGVAATQPAATVSLTGGTYPLNVNGTMTLTFTPAAGGSQIYDAKFANGTGTTATFTIPAGTSQGLFGTASSVPVVIGTVAGVITIKTTLQDSAGTTLTPPSDIAITVNPTVPVITKVTIGALTTTGFTISVTGYSTPRDMTSALFHFTSPTNTQLASADVTVPLTSAFTTWYGSAASNASGSQFTMTVQFSFTGPPGTTVPFITVSVTLTNSRGASNPSTPLAL